MTRSDEFVAGGNRSDTDWDRALGSRLLAASEKERAMSEVTSGQVPSVGRIVHYVAYNHTCLAAIITAVKTDSTARLVDLALFTSMNNVNGTKNGGLQFHFDIPADLEGPDYVPGSWHWPERA